MTTTTAAQPLGVQDRPPAMPETIKYQRFLPKKGPSGAVIFASIFGIMGYGWYHLHQSNAERRELRREQAWARLSLVPLLQAETDRDKVRRLASLESKGLAVNLKEEGVYHTDKYVSPRYVYLPESDKVAAQWWRGMKMFTRNIPYHERADWRGKRIRLPSGDVR